MNVLWLVRDGGAALQEVLEGGENLLWLVVGMVPVVVGGAVCAVGVWMWRAFERSDGPSS